MRSPRARISLSTLLIPRLLITLMPLAFNSTKGGELILDELKLVTIPGHPELPDLEPLTLVATNVLEDSVELRWSEVLTKGQHFSSYELFRTTTINDVFPGDYELLFTSSNQYDDTYYLDEIITEDSHFEYLVRATFSVGNLNSAISNIIVVDLPTIPRVENVFASDAPDDQGGFAYVNWESISLDTLPNTEITHYSVWRYLPDNRGWEHLDDVPASYEHSYGYEAPTVGISNPLEEEFDISIPDEDAEELLQVGQAIEYIKEQVD